MEGRVWASTPGCSHSRSREIKLKAKLFQSWSESVRAWAQRGSPGFHLHLGGGEEAYQEGNKTLPGRTSPGNSETPSAFRRARGWLGGWAGASTGARRAGPLPATPPPLPLPNTVPSHLPPGKVASYAGGGRSAGGRCRSRARGGTASSQSGPEVRTPSAPPLCGE